MGILSRIFGTAENADKLVNGAVKGLDAIVFTEEERSVANSKLNDWYLKYLQATQPQNLARRIIAIAVTAMWALLTLLGTALYFINPEWSEFVFRVLSEVVNMPFMIIIGFYFLKHTVTAYNKKGK